MPTWHLHTISCAVKQSWELIKHKRDFKITFWSSFIGLVLCRWQEHMLYIYRYNCYWGKLTLRDKNFYWFFFYSRTASFPPRDMDLWDFFPRRGVVAIVEKLRLFQKMIRQSRSIQLLSLVIRLEWLMLFVKLTDLDQVCSYIVILIADIHTKSFHNAVHH